MKNNIGLIVIDCQNDFHDHVVGASLPVDGATKDTERLSSLIPRLNPSYIVASLDTHYVLDISHPSWWADSLGNHPAPFTFITPDDVRNGKWTPRVDPTASLAYLDALKANGEFPHIIWPEHCIQGTTGHALHAMFLSALTDWSVKNLTWPKFVTKGVNPGTEHFGIFRANVPDPRDASSNINQALFTKLNTLDELYLAGEARSHCVINSIKQMLDIAPNLASKLVIIEDCMSNVGGLGDDFYNYVDGMFNDAKSKGVRFVKSSDI